MTLFEFLCRDLLLAITAGTDMDRIIFEHSRVLEATTNQRGYRSFSAEDRRVLLSPTYCTVQHVETLLRFVEHDPRLGLFCVPGSYRLHGGAEDTPDQRAVAEECKIMEAVDPEDPQPLYGLSSSAMARHAKKWRERIDTSPSGAQWHHQLYYSCTGRTCSQLWHIPLYRMLQSYDEHIGASQPLFAANGPALLPVWATVRLQTLNDFVESDGWSEAILQGLEPAKLPPSPIAPPSPLSRRLLNTDAE